MNKVLILSCGTGGGHNSAALAIQKNLNEKGIQADFIIKGKYDYVVTMHLFAAEALTSVKKEYPIHFIAVATDYVSIPFWEETDPDYFIIPNKELEQDFVNKGIDKNKLLPLGIPVAKEYTQMYEESESKKKLNLEENKKYTKLLKNLKEIYKNNDRIIPIPYTDRLNEYMKSSEIILSKPGGLTTTVII